jgi:hypothetical protein
MGKRLRPGKKRGKKTGREKRLAFFLRNRSSSKCTKTVIIMDHVSQRLSLAPTMHERLAFSGYIKARERPRMMGKGRG